MNTPRRRTRWSLCLLLAHTPATTGCFAISSFQNARMTEPGPSRATFALSTMGPADDGADENLTVLDMRVRKGLAPAAADIGFAMSAYLAGGGAIMNVGVEPRFAIVNGIVAADLPFYWVVASPLVQFAPGAVLTLPLSKQFEINTSVRAVITPIPEASAVVYPAYTVGLGFSDDLRKWAIRPEVGVMQLEEGTIVQLGVGFQPPVPRGAGGAVH